MQKFTRRDCLRWGAGAGLACASKALLPGCAPPPILQPLGPSAPIAQGAKVAAIRGRDLAAMTREAFDAVGGASAIVHPGETVFIKPNFLTVGLVEHNPFDAGECTKPEILIAAAEACLAAGAAEVFIGDGAQVLSIDWTAVRTLDGSTTMAAEAARLNATYPGAVTLVSLNADSPAWDPLPSPGTSLPHILASSLVVRADRVISVPVLKTHRHMKVTLSLKNFIGVAPLAPYDLGAGYRSRLHLAAGGIPQCAINLAAGMRPDLAIIDASIGCEGYGPFVGADLGQRVDMRDRLGDWLLLASTDLVAADSTAARVIGHDPEDIPHLHMAYEQGLGQAQADQIELIGASLDELIVPWTPTPPGPASPYALT
ncbi:MAG: DUF362 domain-containing protein [Phycisphaerae bacterium]|nr:DUF362 domain-containing protein [Phycisphaerae bacterium]